uniref:Fibrosin-like 1 n=1 Tax=Gasterosteus aculeatus TaxID=69293 RepID=G3PHG5_GASAC
MFATPATLPPPPTLPTNSLVVPGHPAGNPYPERQFVMSYTYLPHLSRNFGIYTGVFFLKSFYFYSLHFHPNISARLHTLAHFLARPPTPLPPLQPFCFDKYAPKLDNPFIRHSNASNSIDVAGRPGGVPHTLLQKDPRITDPYRTSVRQMQLDPHKLDMNGKLDLFSRPQAPGVFPGFPYTHDLARPMFSSTGSGHPAPSPYGHVPHPSGFLPPSHLADPFSRSSSYGGLGNLSSSAFGGLGNPSLGSNNMFGTKEGPGGLPTFGSPHHDTWNRLRRTPPSFPTPPQWPKTADTERSSSANSHEREREREREREKEKRDASIGKEEKDKDRDSVDRNRHSNRSSPASAPVSYQISSLIRSNSQNSCDSGRHHSGSVDRVREAEKELLERHRESSEDSIKPSQRSPSPYSKAVINEQGMKMASGPPPTLKDSERKEPPPAELLHKVKNDMKIKEERKEEQEVMVVSSEPAPPPPSQRLPHQAFPWDPLREAYRSLDLQRRMDFQLRAEQGHRFPSVYEQERAYREREAHDYSHHEHLLELHQSPMEGHLPHMPPFMPHLGGMHYPRLSPSTGHNGPLNRTPPTAALSAPPPLVPAGSARPASPRRTTPLTTQDPRDYSPSRNPKEVEAR